MRYACINHLAFATGDMDMTVRFWRDLLGLRLVGGHGKAGYRQYFLALSGGSLISFFEWPGILPIEEKEQGVPTKGPFAFDHVALGVESEDDLYEMKDKLNSAGIWVSEVIDHGFIHSIYTFDPNGIGLELSHFVSGVDIVSHPVMADTEPSGVTLEGPEPQAGKWPPVSRPTPLDERRVYPGAGSKYFGLKKKP